MIGIYDLNSLIKDAINKDISDSISIIAEISSFKEYDYVIYITLKDIDPNKISTINACIWKNSVNLDNSIIKVSAKVNIEGRINTFIKNGTYQINITNISLNKDFEQIDELEKIKQHYQKLGYFNEETKKKINKVDNICIITAQNGAALQDILHVFDINKYYGKVTIINSLVQGSNCVKSIIKALNQAEELKFDTILITRGGGSKEDLYEFNSKLLIEKVYQSTTPIITAIGHEIDISLIDYVADLKVSTPTRAAEIISGIFNSRLDKYDIIVNSMFDILQCKILDSRHKISLINYRIKTPDQVNLNKYDILDQKIKRLKEDILTSINKEKNDILLLLTKVNTTNNIYPSIILYCETDKSFVLSKAEYIKKRNKGYNISIIFRDGII